MNVVAPRSLAEIRFYVTRAVVGAGAPFGIGEEVAEAVVGLSSTEVMDWSVLAEALNALGNGESTADPSDESETPVSALLAGPVMAWAEGNEFAMNRIDYPEFAGAMANWLKAGAAVVPPPGGVVPDGLGWSIVQHWFNKCLVPSSAESRLSGAGAGLIETD